jgi:hypothetical protein
MPVTITSVPSRLLNDYAGYEGSHVPLSYGRSCETGCGEVSPHSILPCNPGPRSRPVSAWLPESSDPRPGVDSVNR